ncbi:MAG TPA: hypothetical protein VE869_15140 [Gemmatimonas sp.]|nr:hypothetical protein [Gemmatimonas sp.]
MSFPTSAMCRRHGFVRHPAVVALASLVALSSVAVLAHAQPPLLRGKVLVANQQASSATLVDLATGSSTHITVGDGPHEAAVSPDGRTGVITVYGTGTPGNKLAIIDLGAGTVVRTIDLGRFTRPHGATFVGSSNTMMAVTSEATQRVVLVDIEKGAVIGDIATDNAGSHMVGLTADGARAYTANVGSGTVSELDLVTKSAVRQLPIGPRSEGIAVRPDGGEVWVGSNSNGTVSVVDTRTWTVSATLTGFTLPYRLGIAPNGKLAVVVDPEQNRIHILDVATRATLGTIDELGSPRGVSIGADNRTAFITSAGRSSVIAVDLLDRRILKEYPVQTAPDGVAFWSIPRR